MGKPPEILIVLKLFIAAIMACEARLYIIYKIYDLIIETF